MRVILYIGKGGVGKTGVASATALRDMLDRAIERKETSAKAPRKRRTKIEVK